MPTLDQKPFRSLYFHMPFCEAKCHYCDFYSIGAEKTKTQMHEDFEQALLKELNLRADSIAPKLDSIFFGGGTPTMSSISLFEKLFSRLSEITDFSTAEITTEANPSSISLEKMNALRVLGVNRVSIGVQSTDDDILKLLGRVHTQTTAEKAIETVFHAGFKNVSTDLMCGIPGQSDELLRESIACLTSYPITHLSCYLLTLTKGNILHSKLPDEDTQLRHLLIVNQELTSRGFEHYEISNFAKPGFRCRHNLAYWTRKSYLGFGPSAHSFDSQKKRRFKNVSSLEMYSEKLLRDQSPIHWEETLSPEQEEMEQWMLGLRLDEGFPAEWLDSPGRRTKVAQFEREDWIERHPKMENRYRLTPKGLALSDQIVGELYGAP